MINTVKHLSYELRCSQYEILYVIDHIEDYYFDFVYPKKKYGVFQYNTDGTIRMRELYPCRASLKRMQSGLDRFLKRIPMPDYMFGSVKGKSNIENAVYHADNKYFLAVDLKNFFPNITHHQVFAMFLQHNFSPTVARILTKLTTYKGKLLQGPSTSPIIANLVLLDTAAKLDKIAKKHGIRFTCFLDDLSFSSKSDFKFLIPEFLHIIKADRFFVNQKKVSYKTSFPEVTGIAIHKKQLFLNSIILRRATINDNVNAYVKCVQAASQKLKLKVIAVDLVCQNREI